MMFRDVKFTAKLRCLVLGLLAALLFVGIFAVHELGSVRHASAQIDGRYVPAIIKYAEVRGTFVRLRLFTARHFLLTADADMAKQEEGIAGLWRDLDSAWKVLEELSIGRDPAEQQLIKTAKEAVTALEGGRAS